MAVPLRTLVYGSVVFAVLICWGMFGLLTQIFVLQKCQSQKAVVRGSQLTNQPLAQGSQVPVGDNPGARSTLSRKAVVQGSPLATEQLTQGSQIPLADSPGALLMV